jgi:hypothetical protein
VLGITCVITVIDRESLVALGVKPQLLTVYTKHFKIDSGLRRSCESEVFRTGDSIAAEDITEPIYSIRESPASDTR